MFTFLKKLMTTASKSRADRRVRLALENLERREVPAASITAQLLADGTVRIEGTAGNDKIYVLQSDGPSQNVWVGKAAHGQEYGNFSGSKVKRIEVIGLAGSDTIDLSGTGAAHHVKVDSTIYGDGKAGELSTDGNDTITGGDGRDTIYGRGGRDVIDGAFHVDYLYGGSGNDTLYGSSGSDFLYGGADNDHLYGGNQNDHLYGEGGNDVVFGGDGSDVLDGGAGDNNWLEAGSKGETVTNGWYAEQPVVGGISYSDVDQQQMGSCAFLASLASAAKTGRIKDSFIEYKGNYTYSVKFFDPVRHKESWGTAKFDGSMVSYYDAAKKQTKLLDPGTKNYEFWTVVYQRAYYKQFHGIDYVAKPKDGADFAGESTDAAMARLMPYSFARFDTSSKEFTPEYIADRIAHNWGVTASLSALGTGIDEATGKPVVSRHAYMVASVTSAIGITGKVSTFVTLYNPWGSSVLHGTKLDGTSVKIEASTTTPGLFTMNWADFKSMANYFAW